MVKKNLEIQDFEDKKTKADKRYTRFKTSDGWISCFDKKTIEALKEAEGKSVSCEVTQIGDFLNIKKCYGDITDEDKDEVEIEKIPQETKVSKDFHLSVEEQRARALECTISTLGIDVENPEGFWDRAEQFFNWINKGE